jgi:AcrR family transcriptional regulator
VPKVVDHDERRAQIAGALIRVAAKRGLESVSLRHVAAEAGVSSGMVQHYFRTKDEMMSFAMEVVKDNATARLAAAAQTLGDSPSSGVVMRTLLVQLLPLDEARQAEGRVTLAFLAYAAVRPRVAAILREGNAGLRTFVADQLRAAQADAEVAADVDPNRAAAGMLAVVDGLGVQLVGEQFAPADALAVLDAHLAMLFQANPPTARAASPKRSRRPA